MQRLLTRVLLILVFLAPAAANAACWQWSTTTGSNASADPSINWAEGMAPSSINDSGRAMMARIAECRDDNSGKLTTGGTSIAYTVATEQGLPTTPNTGQFIRVTIHATNGVSPTLTADGGTTYPIVTSPGNAVPPGTLVAGTPYGFTLNGTSWVLNEFYGNPAAVPIGAYIPYSGTTSPNSNFVLPFGQCISRTTYATYFGLVGTLYGSCDGVTTFAVPDARGRVLAGMDNMGGSGAGRLTNAASGGVDGTALGATGGEQAHTLTSNEMPSHSHTITDPGHSHTWGNNAQGFGVSAGSAGSFGQIGNPTLRTDVGTTGINGTNSTGGGAAHNVVQPTFVVTFLLRVL